METPRQFIIAILSGAEVYPRAWQLDHCNGFVRADLVWQAFDKWQTGRVNTLYNDFKPVIKDDFFKVVPPSEWGEWPNIVMYLPRLALNGSWDFLPHYRFYPHVQCRPPLARFKNN
jgi:hypothetical protein